MVHSIVLCDVLEPVLLFVRVTKSPSTTTPMRSEPSVTNLACKVEQTVYEERHKTEVRVVSQHLGKGVVSVLDWWSSKLQEEGGGFSL